LILGNENANGKCVILIIANHCWKWVYSWMGLVFPIL